MPDRRKHRGAHPGDAEAFGPARHEVLREAVHDLSWLLSRDYSDVAALKLVGDRYRLIERQRIAVRRAAASDASLRSRRERQVDVAAIGDRPVWIDGFNVLVTVEAALSGGVLLRCRDGVLRDMASMHGSYRSVEETLPAIERVAEVLTSVTGPIRWLFDAPVSNSGRLAERVRSVSSSWAVDVVTDPDRELIEANDVVVASADAGVLDRCGAWCDLASLAAGSLDVDAVDFVTP